MRVLVDADVLAYSCGFASQKSVCFDVDPEIVAEPVEHALRLAKIALENIHTEVNAWLAASGESAPELELYLTGTGNFRDKIATIKPYKANRAGRAKPVHWKAIRSYMADHWGAAVVDGMEADDALAIEAHKCGYDADTVMIASVDKDLKTVPGLLYSFKKKESYLITKEESEVFFYRQIITGDTTDNIGGCYRSGDKAAQAAIREGMSPLEMWLAVDAEYRASLTKKGCPYTDAASAALENARLLHLLRFPEEVWYPSI